MVLVDMLVADYLLAAAEQHPDKPLLFHGSLEHSYGSVAEAAMGIATKLEEFHLEPGFRGAVYDDDPFAYVAAYFGVLLAGGVAVAIHAQATATDVAYLLNDCQPTVLFTSGKHQRLLQGVLLYPTSLGVLVASGWDEQEPLEDKITLCDFNELCGAGVKVPPRSYSCSSHDYAQILYTSGSTGKPKGVVLRHSNLIANTASIVTLLDLTSKDRVMAVLPFFYAYGNSVLLSHVAVGGSLVVHQNFLYPNVIVQLMLKHEVTGFSGVPSHFALLLSRSTLSAHAFPVLRYVTQAGASMPPSLIERLRQALPGVKLYLMYGQTEAGARLSCLRPEHTVRKPGSIGKAIQGVTLSLLDETGAPVKEGEVGEIVARGDNIMAGYWNRPLETAKVLRPEGLRTGDLAVSDTEGFLYIVGRRHELIKSGAHRVGPREIEDVLIEHPAVEEAAVLGVPDEVLDERIRAFVVLCPGAACNEKELKAHCKNHLARYKIPHDVVFLSELPKTSSGKIEKNELRSMEFAS